MATATIAQCGLRLDFASSLPVVAEMGFEDASPFGLQGFRRETLTIFMKEAVCRRTLTWRRSSTGQDPLFVERALARNQDWVQDYPVVPLIEKSLCFADDVTS